MQIEKIRCKTAEEFVEILRPSNKLWNGPLNGWIFRGQRDSSWGLIPSVFRLNPAKWPNCDSTLCADFEEQIKQELSLLRIFVKHADDVGLKIPGDSPKFRRTNIDAYEDPWPESIPLEIIAKCQHHGLPTRFLDFTHHGFVAAHFAVSDSIEEIRTPKSNPSKDKYLVVWAFCLSSYWDFFEPVKRRIQVVSAPSSDNDFLFKQKSLFLFDAELNDEWKGAPENRSKLVNLMTAFEDESLRAHPNNNIFKAKKILLNKTKAQKVNEILYREGFTHSYFRPSYQWVLETILIEHKMKLKRS